MANCKITDWIIGSDKKPTINLWDNNGDEIDIADLTGYGIRLYNVNGGVMGSYGVNLSGFSSTEIVNIGDHSFDVVLDKSINTVVGSVTARVYAIWGDTDFSDSDFDEIGTKIVMFNSINP